MKNTCFLALLFAGAFLFAMSPCVAEDPRVAVISMERVFEKHHKTREANAKLKEHLDEMEKERQKHVSVLKDIRAEVEALEKESADQSLSEAEQQKRKSMAKEKYATLVEAENRLMRFDQSAKKEINEQMRDTQEVIVKDIRNAVQKYARDKNISLVIDNSGKTMNAVEAVIYFDGALDITDAITAILDKTASDK